MRLKSGIQEIAPSRRSWVAIENGWELDWARTKAICRYLPGGIAVTGTGSSGSLLRLSEPVPVQSR
jgi:hypothetical protein